MISSDRGPVDRGRLARAAGVVRRVRRRVLAHRRLLAAGLAAVAVASGLRAVTAPPPPTVAVTVAAHDLPAGRVLEPDDLAAVALPEGAVPDGLVASAVGRTLASPVRRGEPVTDVRLLGSGVTAALAAGLTAAPVRLPDGPAVALLSAGDRIDLLATDPEHGTRVVTRSALVLGVPDGSDPDSGPLGGRLVLLGLPTGDVEKVADSAVQGFLSFTFSD